MNPRLIASLAMVGITGAPAAARPWIEPQPVESTVMAPTNAARILALHNRERQRTGTPPLEWDEALARNALGWAQVLAASGRFEHSPPGLRRNQGENLFMGTIGYYPVPAMIGAFLKERTDFAPGVFPAVSRSGSWHNVGHYTQVIWRDTRRVGCAIARGRHDDVLVCRYWPAGNVMGQRVP